MTKMIFLGAGASVEAGFPTNDGLRTIVEEKLRKTNVMDGMTHPYVTYQEVFKHLHQKRKNTLLPYVGIEDICAFAEMQHQLETGSLYNPYHGLAKATKGTYYKPNSKYDLLVYSILYSVLEVLGVLSAKAYKLDYLEPLLKFSFGNRIPISTLNLDYMVEEACSKFGVPYSIGVQDGRSPQEVSWEEGSLHFCKLHGSVEWQLEHALPENLVKFKLGNRNCLPPDIGNFPNLISIFGTAHKYRLSPPFNNLFKFFGNQLERADELYVIGYSFRDPHINEKFLWWCEGDAKRTIFIANGKNFSKELVPSIWVTNVNTKLLQKRSNIFLGPASEAIRNWFKK